MSNDETEQRVRARMARYLRRGSVRRVVLAGVPGDKAEAIYDEIVREVEQGQ